MLAMSSRMLSASSLRVRSSALPVIAISRPSFRVVSRDVTGLSVSAGNVEMASTLALISFRARMLSAPDSSSTVTAQ